ncbi:MAG: hypothetical protein AB7N76_02585 [Planctomycetota bacterium]
MLGLYEPAQGWRRWGFVPVALLTGVLPLLLGAALGRPIHQALTALLLFALFLSALRSQRLGAAVATVGLVFLGHSVLAIALSAAFPERMAACLPGGADYWEQQRIWITTGVNDEYLVANWLPFHAQLFAAMVVLSYLSLGLLPFYQGFYEVDLMNYYVGQLVTRSDSLGVALGLGWHPWSVCRGLCYVALALVVGQASLARMCGRPLGTPRARGALWGAAVLFFLLDCWVKFLATEAVRSALQRNLLPG